MVLLEDWRPPTFMSVVLQFQPDNAPLVDTRFEGRARVIELYQNILRSIPRADPHD